MKSKMILANFALCLSSMSTAIASQIVVGTPQYGGNGCPSGSVSAILSPDQSALSVIFDKYVAEAGGVTGKSLDRKSCNVAIPVHVPQGLSVAIFKVDYRGYANIPDGGRGMFGAEYFFAGARGPSLRTPFSNTQQDYLISHDILAQALVWSRCGADTILRANTNVVAQTNSMMEDTSLTVDTADITSGLLFHIQWRQCN